MAVRRIQTSQGPAEVVSDLAASPRLDLLLTHGAGGGVDARDLLRLAEALPPVGISVHRLTMPWRIAGKKIAPRPPLLDEAYRAVIDDLRDERPVPLVIGGRSAGARAACRIAGPVGALGVLALAFPLHPPGKPESSRVDELINAGVPTLVVQGDRDPFGTQDEFPAGTNLRSVPFADHGFKVPAKAAITQDEALHLIVEASRAWLGTLRGNAG